MDEKYQGNPGIATPKEPEVFRKLSEQENLLEELRKTILVLGDRLMSVSEEKHDTNKENLAVPGSSAVVINRLQGNNRNLNESIELLLDMRKRLEI